GAPGAHARRATRSPTPDPARRPDREQAPGYGLPARRRGARRRRAGREPRPAAPPARPHARWRRCAATATPDRTHRARPARTGAAARIRRPRPAAPGWGCRCCSPLHPLSVTIDQAGEGVATDRRDSGGLLLGVALLAVAGDVGRGDQSGLVALDPVLGQ